MSNYNEISGRYTELKEDFYIPEKVSSQSKINKQLSEDDNLLENIQIIRQNDYLKNYLKN
jgi:hypothetical protein